MIRGIGLDVVTVSRFTRMLTRYGDRVRTKFFTEDERAYCDRHHTPAQHYAARFAAKEAVLKALNVPKGLTWHDIEVQSTPDGAPICLLHGKAKLAADKLLIKRIWLTLCHERDIATAMVVAEG